MSRRENTFRIEYSGAPKKPSYEELHVFIASDLRLKKEEVLRIQCSRSSDCAFVKVSSFELAEKVVAEHDNQHEIVVGEKRYQVRLRLEDGAVDVKLFDLSEDVSKQKIEEFLSAYGEVLKTSEQMWESKYEFGGIPTGLWVARMVVKKNIPSYVMIDSEVTYVQYFGQHQTCRHCGEFVHNGASCVQNKKLLLQKLSADKSNKQSYANVTKQNSPTGPVVQPKPANTTAAAANTSSSASSASSSTTSNSLTPPQISAGVAKMPPPPAVGTIVKHSSIVQQHSAGNGKKSTNDNHPDGEESDDSMVSVGSSKSNSGRPPSKTRKHDGGSSRNLKQH